MFGFGKKSVKPPVGQEATNAQFVNGDYSLYIDPFSGELRPNRLGKPNTVQLEIISKHPTVWFAQEITVAPLLESGWTLVSDSADKKLAEITSVLSRVLLPWAWFIIDHCVKGMQRYGWQPFEVVWDVEKIDKKQYVIPVKIKDLLQDYPTYIQVGKYGDMLGIKQGEIAVSANEMLYIAQRVRGSNYYGVSTYEAVWPQVQADLVVSQNAEKHDIFTAGSKVTVRYPQGQSAGAGGVLKDNFSLAVQMLKSLGMGNGTVIPSGRNEGSNAWDIDRVSDPVSQESRFINRSKFLDTRILHHFLVPERSAVEGQFGTKAEAGTHGDLALQLQFIQAARIAEAVSDQIVDPFIMYNYGEEYIGRCKVKPAPLDDKRQIFFQNLYMELLKSDELAFMERRTIDMPAIRTQIGVPTRAGAKEQDNIDLVEEQLEKPEPEPTVPGQPANVNPAMQQKPGQPAKSPVPPHQPGTPPRKSTDSK